MVSIFVLSFGFLPLLAFGWTDSDTAAANYAIAAEENYTKILCEFCALARTEVGAFSVAELDRFAALSGKTRTPSSLNGSRSAFERNVRAEFEEFTGHIHGYLTDVWTLVGGNDLYYGYVDYSRAIDCHENGRSLPFRISGLKPKTTESIRELRPELFVSVFVDGRIVPLWRVYVERYAKLEGLIQSDWPGAVSASRELRESMAVLTAEALFALPLKSYLGRCPRECPTDLAEEWAF